MIKKEKQHWHSNFDLDVNYRALLCLCQALMLQSIQVSRKVLDMSTDETFIVVLEVESGDHQSQKNTSSETLNICTKFHENPS